MTSIKLAFIFLALLCSTTDGHGVKGRAHHKSKHGRHRMGPSQTLVLAPPIKDNEYYKEKFESVVPFYKRYVEAVSKGTDGVVLVVDERTKPYYEDIIPDEILLEGHIDDPWTRDVGTPIPSIETQFTYVGGSTLKEAQNTQSIFNKFIHGLGIDPYKTHLKVDGGNMVNNNADKVITTTKFMKDNNLSEEEAVQQIKDVLGVNYVSILTPDEPKLAHSDGMASYVCNNTIYMHKQPELDFNQQVKDELLKGCPHCHVIEVEGFLDDREYKEGYASSCGVYVNCVVTDNYIYVPQFGETDLDKNAVDLFRQNPCHKKVVPIDVEEVCIMGGSLRCLSWQTTGKYANILRRAAREDSYSSGGSGGYGEIYDTHKEIKLKDTKKKGELKDSKKTVALDYFASKFEKIQRELKELKEKL